MPGTLHTSLTSCPWHHENYIIYLDVGKDENESAFTNIEASSEQGQ